MNRHDQTVCEHQTTESALAQGGEGTQEMAADVVAGGDKNKSKIFALIKLRDFIHSN